jgi:magnesium chelatase subunit D
MQFTDIVGLDAVKQALLLLAVDPTLGGCAMAAPVGAGKSTLARAYAALQPDGAPFVELPINITEDRLLGGLDLEATLASGRRVVERGVLAAAHGGVLYVDGLNLLDGSVEAALIETMASGTVQVEREGLSARFPAAFVLLATYDAAEGDVRRGLLDRIGLIAPFTPNGDARARAEVLRRSRAAASDGSETAMLRALLVDARERLPRVHIGEEQMRGVAQAALSLGVEGNRADVFAVKAALAAAALAGRLDVDDDDLKIAARLVLMPRATRIPETDAPDSADKQPPQQQQPDQPSDAPDSPDDEPQDQAQEKQPEQIEALLLSAVEAELPADVLTLPFAMQRRGRSGSRGAALNSRRGKFVRAIEAAPRGNRISVLHTLMAAAPWQRVRATQAAHDARGAIRIEKSDVRVKRYRDKAGTLFIFVVDASGSMAINRMREAKGAVARLLQNAYVHRDQVALVAFRGKAAQVLLPPSTSVERAKRELDVMPTGGGTPLASALWTAWQMAKQARSRGIHQSSVVLMTDGRANVALHAEAAAGREQMADEVQQLAALLRADGIASVVIDTQVGYLSRGDAPKLAKLLGGRYVYLPNARAEQIARQVLAE